jgi:hypothetical protein
LLELGYNIIDFITEAYLRRSLSGRHIWRDGPFKKCQLRHPERMVNFVEIIIYIPNFKKGHPFLRSTSDMQNYLVYIVMAGIFEKGYSIV